MPFDRKKNGRHFKASESTSVHSTENELQGSDGYKPLESKTATYKAPRTKPPAIKAPVSEKVASGSVPERASTSKQGFAAPEDAKFVADTIAEQDHSVDRQASKNKVPKNTVEVSSVNVSGLKEADVLSSSAKLESGKTSNKAVERPVVANARTVTDRLMIKFEKVTKKYHLYKNDRGRFLGLFNYKKRSNYLGSVSANKELSFEIYKGEAVAFLGQNGAGKSTALKIVTGVAQPTAGKAVIKGRVSAILELNAGFDLQLTGRENISLRGQALGLTRAEIKELEPKIVDFAELGVYIDQPIRTYSSGMRSRLGFAFAVSIDPDIFVVDETLSVGDKNFKEKCITRIREIMYDQDVTVLFVTHSSDVAKEFCTRGIVLKEGQIVFDGHIGEAITYYNKNC